MTNWANLGENKGGAGDEVIYYRRPLTGENAGWITWGDSLSGSKLRDYLRRGFEPLTKYPAINSTKRDRQAFGDKVTPAEEGWSSNRYLWESILSHPDGPAEFPVEQIVTYRWYRPEFCPISDVIFPQLEGKKIKEYKCPERCQRVFVDVDGVGGVASLRGHLRIMHGYTQPDLIAYGDRVGIDFTKIDVHDAPVMEYAVAAAEVLSCSDCSETFSGAMAKARLAKHQKSHPKVEVEVVG